MNVSSQVGTSQVGKPSLSVVGGVPVTTSMEVARYFGKRHDNVMQAIQSLLSQLNMDHALNFQEMVIDVQIGSGAVRQSPAFRMTRDGFVLLAMGFTGKKALQFKLEYIDAFNKMEKTLRESGVVLAEHEIVNLSALFTEMKAFRDVQKRAEMMFRAAGSPFSGEMHDAWAQPAFTIGLLSRLDERCRIAAANGRAIH